MMPIRASSLTTALLIAISTTPTAVAARAAPSWTVDPAKSALTFTGVQTGTRFAGKFTLYKASVAFDPAHPETARIAVIVDLGSAVTGDTQRDSALPGKEWFNVAQFPQARFVSTSVSRTGPNAYVANGQLTLHGVTKPLTLPFMLAVKGNSARAKGHTKLLRSAFGVGQGAWSTGQWVALEVGIDIDLIATRQK